MDIRYQSSPKETKAMDSAELRQHYLIDPLMIPDSICLTYSHYDRVIIGGACPATHSLALPNHPELRAAYFLERRELGIINVGEDAIVEADGETYSLSKLDALYLGKGTKEVVFKPVRQGAQPVLYLLSAPAHATHPNQLLKKEDAQPTTIGDAATANRRTIYKYIHLEGIRSCQLVMGLTVLDTGSVWNTMPAHTHSRRMEAYFYFDIPEEHRVVHFMGEPQETRHLFVGNHQAVISPPWSIHSGCGTSNYGFIWGMAGENLAYSDMDPAKTSELR